MADVMDFVRGAEASPLDAALAGGKRALKILDGFEGAGGRFKGVPLGLVALSVAENFAAQAEARAFVLDEEKFPESLLFSAFGEQHLDFVTKCSTLARALVNPATRIPLATTAKGALDASILRDKLEPDEVSQLFDLYVDFVAERSPISRAKSWDDVEAEVMAMGKGMTLPSSLTRYDGATLRIMVWEMAQRLAKAQSSTSVNSSPSSPSSD